jgi:hypothetical protein
MLRSARKTGSKLYLNKTTNILAYKRNFDIREDKFKLMALPLAICIS